MVTHFTPGPYLRRGRYVCGHRNGLQIWSAYVDPCKPAIETSELEAVATLFQASPLLYEALRHQLTMLGLIVNAIDAGESVSPTIEAATILINNALRVARGEK